MIIIKNLAIFQYYLIIIKVSVNYHILGVYKSLTYFSPELQSKSFRS